MLRGTLAREASELAIYVEQVNMNRKWVFGEVRSSKQAAEGLKLILIS
jgi:hypothetical protein